MEKEEARMEVGLGGRSLYDPDAKLDATRRDDYGVRNKYVYRLVAH